MNRAQQSPLTPALTPRSTLHLARRVRQQARPEEERYPQQDVRENSRETGRTQRSKAPGPTWQPLPRKVPQQPTLEDGELPELASRWDCCPYRVLWQSMDSTGQTLKPEFSIQKDTCRSMYHPCKCKYFVVFN